MGSAHRTRDWVNTRGELAGLGPLITPRRERGRWAAVRARRQGASSTRQWAGSQLLTKSSWGPGRLTSARRAAARDHFPRDTQDTWQGALAVHPGNQVSGAGEVTKMHRPHGTVCSPSTWLPEPLRPGKGTKRMPNPVYAFVEYLRTWTEQLRPGKYTKPRASFGQFPCRATWSLSSVD